jgi:hypothetical protein
LAPSASCDAWRAASSLASCACWDACAAPSCVARAASSALAAALLLAC